MEKKFNYKIFWLHLAYWLYEATMVYIYADSWITAFWFYIYFIGVFYLHYYYLVPKLIKAPTLKSISIWFLAFILITLSRKQIAYYTIWNYLVPIGWAELSNPYDFYENLKAGLFGIVRNSAGILGVALGSRYILNQDKSKELKREKTKNELNALKNQIDIPETINILSKLEQKAKSKPESIQDEIIELSNVLRYHLYSKEGEVILSKELEIVRNQLDLYNKLNHSSMKISLEIEDRIIKTGILSKAVGEVLKHTQKVNSVLEINGIQKDTFLKISDGDSAFLNDLRKRIENLFSEQVYIQTSTQAIIIKLN